MTTNTIVTIEPVAAEQCWTEVETAVAAGIFEPLADCRVLQVMRTVDGQDEHAVLQLAPLAPGRDPWGGWSAARRVAVAGRSVEAVLPEVAFGQVVVRALLEEVAGQADGVVAAEQSITVNCTPLPLRQLRDRRPGVGFAVRRPGS